LTQLEVLHILLKAGVLEAPKTTTPSPMWMVPGRMRLGKSWTLAHPSSPWGPSCSTGLHPWGHCGEGDAVGRQPHTPRCKEVSKGPTQTHKAWWGRGNVGAEQLCPAVPTALLGPRGSEEILGR